MLYAITWFVVASLIALWSLAAWSLHALAVWAVSNAGALTQAASGASAIALPDWLAPWVPTEVLPWVNPLLGGLTPFIDGLIQAASALAGGVTMATWVVWGLGSVGLVLLGAGLHLLIALGRRRRGRPGSHAVGARPVTG